MEWFYADESKQQIAVDESQLPALVEEGRIKPSTLVWNETMSDWKLASEVRPGLFGLEAAPPALSPARHPVGSPMAGAPPMTAPTSGTAITSMVLGIVGLLTMLGFPPCAPIFSLPAVICGHIARKQAKDETLPSSNGGLALAGLITGYIGIIIAIIGTLAIAGFIIWAEQSGEFDV